MPTVSEFLIDRLSSNGIKHIFGYPGDYILNFYDKLQKSDIDLLTMTSESAAGFAADAYARVNGIGCACVTYCVGGFNLLNAIAGAYAEKSPVVVISGSPGMKERQEKLLLHNMVGHFECQHRMFEHITCANTVLRDPERAGYEIDRVLTAALQHKQPVYIELPRDVADKSIRYDVYTIGTPQAEDSDHEALGEALQEVTKWINESKKPVIWAGVEVARYGAGKSLIKFAEQFNIPIATTILGKSVINERHPLSLGVYCESTATPELKEIVENSDCLIMLGVMMTDMNFGFMPSRYHKRSVVFASSSSLRVKNHSYQGVQFTDFVHGLMKSKIIKKDNPQVIEKHTKEFAARPNTKLTLQRFFDKINSVLTQDMAIIADVGNALFGCLDVVVHEHHAFLSNAFYNSMGFAVPGSVGLQMAKPNIRPIVIVGDGSFQMTGMEFSTLVKKKSNALVFILNNGGLATEKLLKDGPYNNLHNWEYDKMPSLVNGGVGYKVSTEEDLENAFRLAIQNKNCPSIFNVIFDNKDNTAALKRMYGNFSKKGD